jgi:hypothetical protein
MPEANIPEANRPELHALIGKPGEAVPAVDAADVKALWNSYQELGAASRRRRGHSYWGDTAHLWSWRRHTRDRLSLRHAYVYWRECSKLHGPEANPAMPHSRSRRGWS